MSRYILLVPEEGVKIAYGFDSALGFWIDRFQGEAIVDEQSSVFTGLTGRGLAEQLHQANGPEEHITMALIDMPF